MKFLQIIYRCAQLHQKVVLTQSLQPLAVAVVGSCSRAFTILGAEENGSFNSNSNRGIFSCYLLSRWLDNRQPSSDDEAVVSDGAGKVSIII